ncbi:MULTISPECIES: SMP-30/gluconolactonase/LRE family protein [Niastella]|uniref:SMP-30/gluconolactonase/LRE family protein n=1 Tax=Niastella soli TaxID=2821487 RepID=A0ABS3YV58_9BACT|nr:SMP-30/gluconolactonase/LRE family protein [Niastella soli]MBO9201814.1 SMP-30/gluconolactonase/LRE family protein [Niastella soli]
MKKLLVIAIVVIAGIACHRKHNPQKEFDKSLFRAYDHTAENLFTKNCEGPAVDKEGRLFVVNFQKDGTIGLVQPDGKVELFLTLPGKSVGNSIRFTAEGHMLVADFVEHNVLEVDPESKEVTVYCHDDRFNQPNDLCISKKGIVYASDPNWQKQNGQIWKIGTDKKAVLLKENVGTANGICLSPDEKTLYVNESIQRRIVAYQLDSKGNITGEKTFTTFEDFGMDGMKCDSKGNLYISRYGKGTIAIFNDGGRQIQEVELKGKDVSNITFGGKDNRTCFVTLQDRKCIEKFRTDIAGK